MQAPLLVLRIVTFPPATATFLPLWWKDLRAPGGLSALVVEASRRCERLECPKRSSPVLEIISPICERTR